MAWKPDMTLDQPAVEMSGLCAELDRIEGLSKDELQHLSDRASDVISDVESEYGVTTLRPEVSRETQSCCSPGCTSLLSRLNNNKTAPSLTQETRLT